MLTPQNNLLTDKGWKNITELSVGDEILTTNFAGHGMFSPVLNITEYDYDGYVYEHTSHKKYVHVAHFSLTEGSIVPVQRTFQRKSSATGKKKTIFQIENREVDSLSAHKDNVRVLYNSPLIYNVDGKHHQAGIIRHGTISMTDVDYYRFIAYLIFRTSIVKGTRAKNFSWLPRIRVRERDDPTYLFQLLDKYSIPYRIDITTRSNRPDVGRYISLRHGAAATRSVRRIIKWQKIHERTIPDVIMNSTSPEAITAFLVEVIRINKPSADLADGKMPDTAVNFSVSNDILANQLVELLYKIGYRGRIITTDFSGGPNKLIELKIVNSRYASILPKAIIKRKYHGKVYTLDVINEMAVCSPTSLGPEYAMVVKVN